ncbi:unnamed protein product [Bursaphelenchus xylophilus]|uniref:(pine wood nematode) hypothetical protein n=1 Tax=Bursaphelenchus xylophilus TaxID=6326 RepID=A0A1I7RM57_BURXY|nr:unnamed protein product [Bursaphelenchus xylophilus]CAG9118221.1 unnamed protein product [Bursaphelenchus xylophilus]
MRVIPILLLSFILLVVANAEVKSPIDLTANVNYEKKPTPVHGNDDDYDDDDDEGDPSFIQCVKCKAIVQFLKMINYEALSKKNKEELKEYLVKQCENPLAKIFLKKACNEIKNDGPLLDVIFRSLRRSLTQVYRALRPSTGCPRFEKLKTCDDPPPTEEPELRLH